MAYSEPLAGLLGPVLTTIGLAMLTNRRSLEAMVGQMPASLQVVFLAGLLLLVAGLSIVRVHNLWVADWRVVITLAGWFSVFGGLVRMLMPEQSAAVALPVASRREGAAFSGLLFFLLGLYLSLKGYRLIS
jgi:hypothetical protein